MMEADVNRGSRRATRPPGAVLAADQPMSVLRAPAFTLLAILASACSNGEESPTGPTNPNVVHYTVLGASDGVGVGGSIVCAPFDIGCENGTGYAQTIRRRFQADGRTIMYTNLSVPGA